jgi:signal transduction histidine kinase
MKDALRLRLTALEWQIDLAQRLQEQIPSVSTQLLASRDMGAAGDEHKALQLVIDELTPRLRASTCALLLGGEDGTPLKVWFQSKGPRFEAALLHYYDAWLQGSPGPLAGGRIDLRRQSAQPIVFFGFRDAIVVPLECTITGKVRRGVLWAGYQLPTEPTDLEVHVMRMAGDEVVRQVSAVHVVQKAEEAESAAREKGEFLAHMSHDIRTPLNNIRNIFALLKEEASEEERQELITMGMANAQSMTELLTTILDFTRHRVGALTAEPQIFDLRQVIKDLVTGFTPTARSKGLTLKVEDRVLEQARLVHADPQQIKRVLTNIISNALKFTDRGTVTIGYSAGSSPEWETVVVADTGRGMKPEHVQTLFTPFSRFDHSVEGIGLGLALSKVLMGLNGGSLSAESELGKGTQFTIRMRSAAGELVQNNRNGHQLLAERLILLADDDRDVVETTGRILERAGFRTLRATSATAALAILRSQTPDLVVCDRHLGDGSVEDIRAYLDTRGCGAVPVIVLSGDSSLAELRTRGLPVLEKPIEPRGLLCEIERILQHEPKAVGGA